MGVRTESDASPPLEQPTMLNAMNRHAMNRIMPANVERATGGVKRRGSGSSLVHDPPPTNHYLARWYWGF